MQYGDTQFDSDPIGDYQGDGASMRNFFRRKTPNTIHPSTTSSENSRLIKLFYL